MRKRAILNFAVSILYQFTNILIGMILPKYYTEIFGSAYNGLNQSVSQIMSLLSILQFGISATAFQQMFQYIADRDEDMLRAIYWDTGRQYRKMGYIFLAAILPIVAVFPYFLEEELPYKIVAVFLLVRAISAAMEYFFQAKYTVFMIANNKSYAVYTINIITLLTGTALHLTVLFTSQNILMYQFVAPTVVVLRLIIVNAYVRRKFPYLFQKKAKRIKVLSGAKRKDVLISEIAGMISESADMVILSVGSGLIYTSIYSVYNFVTAGLGNVLGSCREAVFAGIGKKYYENFEEFKKEYDDFESIYIFLMVFLYATALLLFRSFVEVYTANMDTEYYFAGLPVLFVIAKLIINLRVPSQMVVNTAGHFKEVKMYAVMEALIKIVLSVLLVKPFGIYGVLIGTVAGALYRTPLLVRYANKYIVYRKQMECWKKVLLWLPVLVAAYLIGEFVAIECDTLLQWALMAIVGAVAVMGTAVIWLLIADKKTLNNLKQLLLKKKKIG